MNNISYRDIIEQEFNHRTGQNPAYSLRSFARDLKINPSQLCEIRKGKIGLSTKKAMEVAKNLGLLDKEIHYFKALVEIEHGRSDSIRENAKKQLASFNYNEGFQGLTQEMFEVISSWQHYAILSAMELDEYDGSLDWIANNLNLPLSLIGDCIKRLIKLDMIDFQNGKFICSGAHFATPTEIASKGIKLYHKQHLNKAMRAVDEVPVDERDLSSITMAIDKERLPEAKEMLKKFRREFCHVMENGNKNSVYSLNLQLIPLKELE